MQTYGDEVRGVSALVDIEPESTIVTVPLKCLITVEMGKATDVGQAVIAADLELDAPKHVFLMLYMLIDRRNPHSFFRPYYDILPKKLSNMPIFWTPEELAWLQGSYLLRQIEERKAAIRNDYAAICDVWPAFAEVASLDDFSWARMCVCSRNFGVVVDGLRTSAMVPHADMLNHYRPRETKWTYDNARGAFTITSIKVIRAGAQVYDSYGQKCNHRFLLNYGKRSRTTARPTASAPTARARARARARSPPPPPHPSPLRRTVRGLASGRRRGAGADRAAVRRDDALCVPKTSFWLRDDLGEAGACACATTTRTRALFSLLRVLVADAVRARARVPSAAVPPARASAALSRRATTRAFRPVAPALSECGHLAREPDDASPRGRRVLNAQRARDVARVAGYARE